MPGLFNIEGTHLKDFWLRTEMIFAMSGHFCRKNLQFGTFRLTHDFRLTIVATDCLTLWPEAVLEHSNLVLIAESILRIILGWRFLISGLSNVRRWPNPVQTASLLFPRGATLLGFVATVFMVFGGVGVAAGFQTPICSLMLIIFLIPTFSLHYYWLKVLPTMAPVVKNAINDEKAQNYFRGFDRQSYHAHEVGIRDNLVLLATAVYFLVRGSGAFGLDNLMSRWVIRFF